MAENWMVLALAAVVLLGVANVLLKLVALKADDLRFTADSLVSVLPVVAVAILTLSAFLVWQLKPPSELLILAAGWVVASALAAGLIFLALQKGSASVVTAMLALSAVVVAVLSFFLLGEKLTSRQLLGIGLAMAAAVAFAA
ncbi:EamA family transporter [Candidatus Micrarchaeota archaeon]|nr:EamA family transporter [Candidatus Micrarchaeota archaeon]